MLKKLILLSLISTPIFAEDAKIVWEKINEVDSLRTSLAKNIPAAGAVTEETFGKVCKPVGMKAKSIAEEKKWMFKQISIKNRNDANAVDDDAKKYYEMFEKDLNLKEFSYKTTLNGTAGERFLKRITVEQNCLACHGDKEARPEFIKKKYANDKAFGFKAGDLRGLYSVFVPEKK